MGSPASKLAKRYTFPAAILADDFPGMKPRMLVSEGDTVKRGQPLFEDRKAEGVVHTAPGSGVVEAVNRGARRALQSVVIKLSDAEVAGKPSPDDFHTIQAFAAVSGKEPSTLTRQEVTDLLVESGAWTSLRARPFSRVPATDSTPKALFVTATDTNPLAPQPEVVIERRKADFQRGLAVVAKLCDGPKFLCIRAGSPLAGQASGDFQVEQFEGPHPSGLVGTHIHTPFPTSRDRVVWHLNYQDVIAIGYLFAHGAVDSERVIALAGPPVKDPRLVLARSGADLVEVVEKTGAVAEGVRGFQGDESPLRLFRGRLCPARNPKVRFSVTSAVTIFRRPSWPRAVSVSCWAGWPRGRSSPSCRPSSPS